MSQMINKLPVFLLTWNICLASLYFGANMAAYNSAGNVVVKLNGWSGTKTENLALVLMTSALPLGAMLASPFTVKVNSIFEGNLRRASIAVDSLAIIACIIQLVDYSLANLIIGRVIAGAIIGINCTLVPTYIAEISPIPLRGLTWRIVIGYPVVFAVIRMLLLTFGPLSVDTPSTLVAMNRQSELNSLLSWIYIDPADIEKIKTELNATIHSSEVAPSRVAKSNSIQSSEAQNKVSESTVQTSQQNQQQYSPSLLRVQSKENRQKATSNDLLSYNRRFLLGFLMSIGQQLTGINTVMFYSNKIFEDAGQASSARYYSIILGFVQVFSTFAGAILSERSGRRVLMLRGTLAIIIALMLIWIFLVLGLFVPSFLAVCFYLIAFSLSQGPLVWAYQGEILEKKALQINTCALWFFTLVIGVSFPYLNEMIREASFGLFGAITLAFLFYFMKEFLETSGKSRQQIFADFASAKILLQNKGSVLPEIIQT